jgi:hypothetical protein
MRQIRPQRQVLQLRLQMLRHDHRPHSLSRRGLCTKTPENREVFVQKGFLHKKSQAAPCR